MRIGFVYGRRGAVSELDADRTDRHFSAAAAAVAAAAGHSGVAGNDPALWAARTRSGELTTKETVWILQVLIQVR